MAHQIFISYRRDDSADAAKQVQAHLCKHFGESRVFFDLDNSIGLGEDFLVRITTAIAKCKAMLVIISKKWLTLTDPQSSTRRIDLPDDYVNHEIYQALVNHVHIIPVLVDGTVIPHSSELPERLRLLPSFQAIDLRSDASEAALDKIVEKLELVLYGSVADQIQIQLSSFQNRIGTNLDDFNERLNEFQSSFNTAVALGLHMVSKQRKGFDAYYEWVTSKPEELDLYCAGRSVLHRMEEDITTRTKGFEAGPLKIENILAAKLEGGAKIRVLLLDPTWEMVEHFAKDEKQAYDRMLRDLAQSIGICKRLYDRLYKVYRGGFRFPTDTLLEIRICREIPYYAYHQHGEKVITGFYFMEKTGARSAAFEIRDDDTKRMFYDHFDSIFKPRVTSEDSKVRNRLVINIPKNTGTPEFDDDLYRELRLFFLEKLSANVVDDLMPPSDLPEIDLEPTMHSHN